MRRRRSDDSVVNLFTNKVDAKSNKSDAQTRSGLTEIAGQ